MNALLNPQDDFTPHAIEDEKQQIYHASRSVPDLSGNDQDLGSTSILASAVCDHCVLLKHDTVVSVAPCQKTGS